MLDLKYIRSHLDEVKEALRKRGSDIDLSAFEKMDEERRSILRTLEDLRHRRNTVTEEIATRKRDGADASEMIVAMKQVSSEIKDKLADLGIFFQAIPSSQLERRITYVDLVIELMLFKKDE